MRFLIVGCIILLLSMTHYEDAPCYMPSRSQEKINMVNVIIVKAWAETDVPQNILRGLIYWECGNKFYLKVKNKNGTTDHGPGLNSKWLTEYAWRFNKGRPINPHSVDSIMIVARILRNNHNVFHDWNWTLTSYRRGINGAIKYGIDWYYVKNVFYYANKRS